MIYRTKMKAVRYTMSYKRFKGTDEEWTANVWELFNTKNNSRNVLKLDVLQGGNDGTGFYPNYIELIVKNNDRVDWDSYLEELNYDFDKDDITLLKIEVEWGEDFDEVVAEME